MKPTNKNLFLLLMALALILGTISIACEGPTGSQGQRGEQGDQGEQGPQGADGNANVTLYVFDGHDFNSDNIWNDDANHECIEVADEAEWAESHWSAFVRANDSGIGVMVSAGAFDATFGTYWNYFDPGPPLIDCEDQVFPIIRDLSSPVDAIHVLQIRASNVVEAGATTSLKATPELVTPADLDMTDYDAIVEYYGLTEDDIVRL